ncbi:MAG: hypothetical protein B6D64_14215 [Bacteroidetes bacterium 4484_276]|nr:MAG: hypothetical protein B6D64_14215 [Bacteroidetes bacterium 4484_276]OYT12135.1 MAG: hypothetical protein B6I19_10245 [Bacteroidetes bacterium 4572_114]
MKKLFIIVLLFSFSLAGFSQISPGTRSCATGGQWDTQFFGWADGVNDFTITDSDGTTHNLYETLDAGQTVMLDLFQAG